MNAHIRAALFAATVVAAAGPALAQDGEYGSAVAFTKRNCPSDSSAACDGRSSTAGQSSQAGGSFKEVNANFAATGTGVGSTAFASVNFGGFGLPTIKARVNSVGNVRLGAFVVSYQVYEYTGETPLQDLRLSAAFHIVDSSTDGGNGTLPGGAIAGAGFTIWDEDDFFAYSDAYFTGTGNFASPGSLTSQGALFGTVSCGFFAANADPLDLPVGPRASNTLAGRALSGGETTIAGGQENCGGAPVSFRQGDEFVIASYVQLIANRNASIDATGTFTLGLDPTMSAADQRAFRENVTFAAGGAVPEPATWAMMIAGFGLVGGAMRRRGHAGRAIAA